MDALSYLFSLELFGIKFGLENIAAMVARLGHPERAFASVHIAGTNGKGSVTAMVDAVLRAAGHRSARYTSPHLVELAERFVIDGRPVDADSLCRAAADVREAIQGLRATGDLKTDPTFFEATTAVAFELFRRAAVEIAVLEVGLGGRLDSTNVITPVVAAITSIDFDHQHYLGSTLGEIAAEKAGIIKPGVPVVVGDMATEAFDRIAQLARERDAPLIQASEGVEVDSYVASGFSSYVASGFSSYVASGFSRMGSDASSTENTFRLRTPARDYGEIRLALRGAHQVQNAVVAVRLLEVLDRQGFVVPPHAIVTGLAEVTWPGRLDRRLFPGGRELILDAAHNPAGARALAAYLTGLGGDKPSLVFAAMKDKDTRGMLRALVPVVSRVIVTRASNRRAADPDMVADEVRAVAPEMPLQVIASPCEAINAGWAASSRVVVAGSIFLLGDVMKEIGA